MKTMAHDLLTEPILSWRDTHRRRGMTTLPGLLARLATGELGDFPRLRAHQFHPWCMFLTQLAAITLRRAGEADPRRSETEWRELLLGLTAGAHEPWCLVVDDFAKPGFFQPPVPEGSIHDWRNCESPDDLDVVATAKIHDVKSGLISPQDCESWVYALTTLQTTQGYPGRGYHGIARMNGGYGNRPRVGLASDQTLGRRFLRDIDVLLASWASLLGRGYRSDGLALVWLQPWDGREPLPTNELSPHFIEVCWRVRLASAGHNLSCHYTTTGARRCLPEIKNGDVGDPWIPVDRETGAALTVGARGFDYRLVARLLFGGDFEPAAAQLPRSGDGEPMLFVASAMARGQGKTEGLHERTLMLTGSARRKLGQPEDRAAVALRATGRVVAADKMRSKVLYPALKQIALGDTVVAGQFDARIDQMFFDHLFATIDLPEDEARLAFDARAQDLAWDELQHAIDRCCVPDARRLRAISEAERMFHACLGKNFPDLAAAHSATERVSS